MSSRPADSGTQAAAHPANFKRDGEGDVAAVTIDRPPEVLYRFWRNFENLPAIFRNVISIETLDEKRSRWRVKSVGGHNAVEWTADVTEDIPERRIAWRTVGDADVENTGWIEFRDGPPGRGSEVRAYLDFAAPLGPIGRLALKALRKDPGTIARIELRRFKQFMETGEVAVTSSE